MKIEIRCRDDVATLAPKGMLFAGKETDELESRIRDLAEQGNRKLIVEPGGHIGPMGSEDPRAATVASWRAGSQEYAVSPRRLSCERYSRTYRVSFR